MKFYYINSLKDIKTGFFGVREPDTDICCEVADFNDSICIVPAIAYDKKGYRLGYGKGYYDRFLENFSFISVGLCYNELIMDVLPIGEYDIPVDYIITQDGILTI
ncbi:MAG: 5-formyltetrahydrofolate cyclo-ligase, partial [Eubacterium sp.]|nr:5-formyltetrahydrofolate cyclo-ligase [Eubacterium sp.]